MGIITKTNYTNIEREKIYIVMEIDLLNLFGERPMRVFTSIEKARDYLKKIKIELVNSGFCRDIDNGIFEGEFGLKKWKYRIYEMELDTEYGEQTSIGHIPAFQNE